MEEWPVEGPTNLDDRYRSRSLSNPIVAVLLRTKGSER